MDVELEFDKKCRVSLSPKTVLPLYPKSLNTQEGNSKGRRDQSLVVEDGRDIRFECHRSASCRIIPSRLSVLDGPMELKRGSVYQDSREVRKLKRMGDGVSRRKIEISHSGDTKHAESSKPDGMRESHWDLPVHPALIRVSSSKPDEDACSSDGFIEFSLDVNDRQKLFRNGLDRDLSYFVEEVNGHANDGNILFEEDEIHVEVSEKLETPQAYSICQSVDKQKSLDSTKSSRFSPIKKMMDPFLKSMAHRSPLSFKSGGQNDGKTGCGKSSNEPLPNPIPCNFLEMKEHVSGVQESPALLHACLKLKTKSEAPLFEFTMKWPEVNFLARIWKRNSNAGDWVYTFHSVNPRKCRDLRRWGSNKDCKELPIVGHMQVSSWLCPDSNSIADKSMVTEFVLYDLANTNQSKSVHDSSDGALDISHLLKIQKGMLDDNDISEGHNMKQGLDAYPADLAYPWEPATLHPNLETAAIIFQTPTEKIESLKFNNKVVNTSDNPLPDVNIVNIPEVIVVTPTGCHSLPDAENQGPSSLLERWRLGGGCECGGWDMGCPLNVFSNSESKEVDSISHEENTNHFELLVQGGKCKTSALSIKAIEEGKYNVAFHARLSALQAFSISVAMLHGSETSSIHVGKNSERITQRISLKPLIEHELKRLKEAFTKEDTKQIGPSNKESHLSFAVNPPFSPMSRV